MPLRRATIRRLTTLGATIAAFSGAAPAAQASYFNWSDLSIASMVRDTIGADESCTLPTSGRYFERWGDQNWYVPSPDSDFEGAQPLGRSGAVPEWRVFGRGSVVSGNDPYNLMPGSRSLLLNGGSAAVSPVFCVDATMPHFRYMIRSSALANLRAVVLYRNPDRAGLPWLPAGSKAHRTLFQSNWEPSDFTSLSVKVPSVHWLGNHAFARIVFVAGTGQHQIDNVLLDPYRAR